MTARCGHCGRAPCAGEACRWERFAYEWYLIGAIASKHAIVCRMRRAAPAVLER